MTPKVASLIFYIFACVLAEFFSSQVSVSLAAIYLIFWACRSWHGPRGYLHQVDHSYISIRAFVFF